MRVTGKVKWFSDEKSYGFLSPEDGSEEIFVHRADLSASLPFLIQDQRVSFEVAPTKKGNGKKAVKVELA